MSSNQEAVRTRDPDRRDRILRAAADLLADRGFHGVSMAEIGGAAGIVGSGVYRHFDSKSAVLVALLDEVMDRLLATASTAAGSGRDEGSVLADLVRGQVLFAVDDRPLLQLYQREVHNLPEADRRRLRRLQRHYVEEWVHLLLELRPDLADGTARAKVHAAIGAVQSVATYDSGLPRDEVVELLTDAAYACLGLPA
ncbi:TetR/AcrR family transcriptional regulator [Klenkia sp. PcliD-1-E]|uniref:TetR/AcrR family transcriptional regulator n=1 Tax=Klenkia sp. PcliD-1-E TaxID=2954492 RepID=UPI002096FE7D|nr:TetR/AcrR family transcriptional regulator [Klenkia sp. PcliD-1-E]MCO7221433.1 TetR/AcrR family transcriptional regulator [Klenkia sp. PcliD-1-E]